MRPSHLFLAALLLATPLADAHAADIEALSGEFKEPIRSIKKEAGRLILDTGRRKIPLESVKSIRIDRTVRRRVQGSNKIILSNGDWLRGALGAGNEDAFELSCPALGRKPTKIPLEAVRAILPNTAPDEERSLEKKLRANDEDDWVLLRSGGTARGTVTQIDGTQVGIDTSALEGEGSNMGLLNFDLSKVHMVSVSPLSGEKAAASGLGVALQLSDGSSLRGALVSMDKGVFKLKHPLAKTQGKQTLDIPLQHVAQVVVHNGLFVYLSDLQPSEVEQRFPPEYTYEVEIWGWKRDVNVTGGKLKLNNRVYNKGLGVHSHCTLTYRLDKRYSQFRSVIGLDDSTRYLGEPGFGAVSFRILVDGKPAQEYSSGITQRKGQRPSEIKVDLRGKSTLTLVADFDPTSLHVLGRANWADAHLVKLR